SRRRAAKLKRRTPTKGFVNRFRFARPLRGTEDLRFRGDRHWSCEHRRSETGNRNSRHRIFESLLSDRIARRDHESCSLSPGGAVGGGINLRTIRPARATYLNAGRPRRLRSIREKL